MNLKEAGSPADVYEQFFVPALFRQWGEVMVDVAGIETRQRVLDVACGTGVLACAAAQRVGGGGAVTGLDPNEDMLAVARRKSTTIEWLSGRAEALPFNDQSFDVVVSQFGLMFFDDRWRRCGRCAACFAPEDAWPWRCAMRSIILPATRCSPSCCSGCSVRPWLRPFACRFPVASENPCAARPLRPV